MKKILITLPFLVSFLTVCGQPLWQQHVQYNIWVELNTEQKVLHANETITYTNQSPDTLHVIYMHLWPNAYGSKRTPMAKQLVENGKLDFQFASEEEMGFIDSIDFRAGATGEGGQKLEWHFMDEFGEIAEIKLPLALNPGDAFVFSTPFRVKIPHVFSRMGFDGQTWQITQWYPKPAVYDENGWHTMPYLDQGEFYSEFGNFDVTIVVPENMVVAAGGDLQTESEKEWLLELAERSGKYIKDKKGYRAWPEDKQTGIKEIRYKLENAHDFAWFASANYLVRHKSFNIQGKNIDGWSFFTTDQDDRWWMSVLDLERSVKYFSEKVGLYPYNNVTVVSGKPEAGGGMEYPAITVISGSYELSRVILHEVGHNWFYGILASNERDYPWMDEGFTSYYENRYFDEERLKDTTGYTVTIMSASDPDKNPFWLLNDPMLLSYIMQARQERDQPIHYHSANYTWTNYGSIVYGKAAAAIKYLASYLGQQQFDSIMQEYYQRYKFSHPQPQDIERIFKEMATKEVDWFFSGLINSTKKIDYSLQNVSDQENGISFDIQNITGFAVPVLVRVFSGEKVHKEIWLDGFIGDTSLTVSAPGITKVVVNPPDVVPEINFRNNYYIKGQNKFKATLGYAFERKGQRQLLFAPAAGYNIYDGFMLGAAFYSNLIIPQRIEYAIAPLFSFRNATVNGIGEVRVNFFGQGEKLWSHFALGVEGRRFSYENQKFAGEAREDHLSYVKLSPFVNFSFQRLPLRNLNKHSFTLRSVLINEEVSESDTTVGGFVRAYNRYIVNELSYRFTRSSNLSPLATNLNLQHGPGFVKFFGEANLSRVYNKKGKKVDFRLFGGKFLHADNLVDNRFAFRMGGKRGHWDYMYDHLFFGRNQITPPAGIPYNQIVTGDGNFKIAPNIGNTQNWLLSLNTVVELPWRLPVGFYGSIATWDGIVQDPLLGDRIMVYEAGAVVKIVDDIFEIYFPAVYTPEVFDMVTSATGDKYFNRITFMLNLSKLDPFELRNKIKLF